MFMLDIETSGLDKVNDDVMQIAALKLEWEGGFFKPTDSHFGIFLPTAKEPSEFAKKSPAQMALYTKCNELAEFIRTHEVEAVPGFSADPRYDFSPPTVRGHLVEFLGPKAEILGLNVGTFDIKFLEQKRYLLESDYHYQIFDVTGAIEYILRLFDLPRTRAVRDALKNKAKTLGNCTIVMPQDGGPHDGIYDCYDQTRELNGYLLAGRSGYKDLVEGLK